METKAKILVIHPKDNTTDFLSEIYRDLDCTVIREHVSTPTLKQSIKTHDEIIMLGHGDECGLHGYDDYVITSKQVYLLREKKCVAIWCNADVFFKKYKLNGIYSGMIISDYNEAHLLCLNDFTQSDIDISNELFAKAVRESLKEDYSVNTFLNLYDHDENTIVCYNRFNYGKILKS